MDDANGENASDGLLTSLRLLGYDQSLRMRAGTGRADVHRSRPAASRILR